MNEILKGLMTTVDEIERSNGSYNTRKGLYLSLANDPKYYSVNPDWRRYQGRWNLLFDSIENELQLWKVPEVRFDNRSLTSREVGLKDDPNWVEGDTKCTSTYSEKTYYFTILIRKATPQCHGESRYVKFQKWTNGGKQYGELHVYTREKNFYIIGSGENEINFTDDGVGGSYSQLYKEYKTAEEKFKVQKNEHEAWKASQEKLIRQRKLEKERKLNFILRQNQLV